jgi:ribose transport system permease protein
VAFDGRQESDTGAHPLEAPPPVRSLAERTAEALLEYGIYVAVAAEIIIFAALSPFFLSVNNFLNIAQAASVLGIVAAAFFVGLVGGRVDLSLAAIVSLTTVVMARVVSADHPLWLGLIVAFGAAMAAAALSGVIAITFRVNPLVTSLAAMTFVSGISLVISQGQTRAILSPTFQDVIFDRPLGIPTPVYVLATVYAVLAVVMYKARVGWHIYAVGGNEVAAERAAIKVKRVYWFIYLLTAALAWLAGVITAGRAGAGSAALGPDVFNVMTAVLLGGIGFAGGGGRIERTLVGVFFIAVLENGLVLLNVPSFYGDLIRGAALVLAVVLSSIRDRRLRR